MVLGIHFANSIDNNTLFINDVGGAQRAFGHLAVHLLLTPSLVGFQDSQVGVGDEMERQVVFGNEVLVRLGTIAADAQHVVAQCQKTLIVVTKVTGLGGAAWRAVLGIEGCRSRLALQSKGLSFLFVTWFVCIVRVRKVTHFDTNSSKNY